MMESYLIKSIKNLKNIKNSENRLVLKSSLNEGSLTYERRGFSLKTIEVSLKNNNFSYEKGERK